MRRPVLLLVVLPLLLASVAVVWSGAGLPPPLWVVKYGPRPGCEPTGEVVPVEGVEFVMIGPGCFRMGSNARGSRGDLVGRLRVSPERMDWGTAPRRTDEMPLHWVEFPRGFGIARTEVTNVQYERFDPAHERSGFSDGDGEPVVNVSWEEAKAYCAWLAERSGHSVRLPTESEWECACRAGSETEYSFGDDESDLADHAWFDADWESGAHEVGTKLANAWGLFDLHGNVWEWCEDLWHGSYVVKGPVTLPTGRTAVQVVSRAPDDGTAWQWEGGSVLRVYRGGSWGVVGRYCRSALRLWALPGVRGHILGFRPALGPSND